MPDFINRTTRKIVMSGDVDYHPSADWAQFPSRAAADTAIAIPVAYRVIDPDDSVRTMNTTEKDADLTVWQAQHKAALKSAVNSYGTSRYSERDEMRLKHIYSRATQDGLVNRAAYVKAALDWDDTVCAEYLARLQAIDDATTHDGVFAVSLDFSAFDATDPMTSVGFARGVID